MTIELTKDQKEALSRLNALLLRDYGPVMSEAMLNTIVDEGNVKEFWEMNTRDKSIYTQGYGKAIWDVTKTTFAAEDGYLPTDEELDKWEEELDEETQKHFTTKKVEKDGYKFVQYIPEDDSVPRVSFEKADKIIGKTKVYKVWKDKRDD